MSVNQEQIDYWNGPGGERWVRHQEILDRMVRPFGLAAMARLGLRPGEAVLDVGCGCGETTGALAEAVAGSGFACGVDISAPMLARARERWPYLQFVQADVSQHDLGRSFDAIFSRFGVMFFADPVAAFHRLRAALSPSGRLAFVCWRAESENPWQAVPFAAVRSVLPGAPLGVMDRGTGAGPFAFADRGRVASILADAGYSGVRIEPFEAEVEMSTTGVDAAVDFALTAGPASRLLAAASSEDRRRAAEAVAAALSPYLAGGRIGLPGRTWVVTARG